MKEFPYYFLCGLLLISLAMPTAQAQTKIAKEQIEDAFVLKNGDSIYGDLTAATSAIVASTFQALADYANFKVFVDGPHAVIRSNLDLYLDPTDNGTAGAVIVPCTLMECPDYWGDKIRFYSHLYKIGVSPNDLDLTSDLNIKFHSDTVEDLMIIAGNVGDASAKRDLLAGRNVVSGNLFSFINNSEGDKIHLYGSLYKIGISAYTMDFQSDQLFAWHSDEHENAMTLDADTGALTITGPLKLPVFTSLPGGYVGQLIYFDHTTDNNQDGAYIYTSAGWQKL